MKFAAVCTLMEEIAPRERACDWDHVGLMIGDREAEVTGVLTCLDVTMEVLREAVALKYNVIISHHPFYFHPLCSIDYTTPRGQMTAFAIKHGLNIFSAHTNLDYAEEGVNRALASFLGLSEVHWDRDRHHLAGKMQVGCLQNLFSAVSAKLNVPLKVIIPAGVESAWNDCVTVGISCGAFDGEIGWCPEEGVQVLITGEVKHSDAVDLKFAPFVTVSAGHYGTEHVIIKALSEELTRRGCTAKASEWEQDPFQFVEKLSL